MQDLPTGIDIIINYEGYNEKAFPDPTTGGAPYTIGFGTQYYPDGEPVERGQLCTYKKAKEYLLHEVEKINKLLIKEMPDLDECMKEALISFIHSIGWEPFLYSDILDTIEENKWDAAAEEMYRWVFDQDYQVISNLIHRRRDEIDLFLTGVQKNGCGFGGQLLLNAFMLFDSSPNQIKAIKRLESGIHPIILAEFANEFKLPILQQGEITV
jgi:lysozyme